MKFVIVNDKVHFDPSNEDHIRDYAFFKKNSSWKNGCRYILEQPFFNIPSMIDNKLLHHFLKPYIKKD